MSETPQCIDGWIAALEQGATAAARLELTFPHCTVEVRTNSEPLAATLAEYFRDFPGTGDAPQIRIWALEAPATDLGLGYTVKAPDPGKTKVKEEFVDYPDGRVVRKRLTGMLFLFGGERHLAYGPCLDNANQVINFVNNRYIQFCLDRGYLLGHAAAVSCDDQGLALAGFSGMGKSTLALEIMTRGVCFVSNDRLLVRRDGADLEMLGVAKLPRVNPGTVLHNPYLTRVMSPAERLAAMRLPEAELWDLEQKYDVDLDRCFGAGKFSLQAPMTGLVVLNWQRAGGPLHVRRVAPAERTDLLGAFIKSVGLFYEPTADAAAPDFSAERYLEVLGDCPLYEFTGGVDFVLAADACCDLLKFGELAGRAREARRGA